MDMDNTWIFPGCFTIGTTQDSWQRSLFLLQAIDYSNVPNSQKELHQSSSSSAVQSLLFLQKLSLSLMFFLERSGFFAALLETIQKSCPHCQDTILQLHNKKHHTLGDFFIKRQPRIKGTVL